jgi:hypothetical protein
MNFSFGGFDDLMETAELEIYLGNQLVQKQTLQAPAPILKMQLMGLAQDLANDNRPMKMLVTKQVTNWSTYQQKNVTVDEWLEFKNNAMCNAEGI